MSLRPALAILTAITFLSAPEDVQGQIALRVTPVVGVMIFASEPPSHLTVRRNGESDLKLGDPHFRNSITLGVFNGIHLNPRWEIEALLAWVPTEMAAEQGLLTDEINASAYVLGLDVNYHVPLGQLLAPYVSLGAGVQAWQYGVEQAEVDRRLMLQAGAGFDFRLGRYYEFRVDARDCITAFEAGMPGLKTRPMHQLVVTAGLTFVMPKE